MAGSIGPYRILRKLGAGGMGDVFLAEDERLGRRVALKCPSDDWLRYPDSRARLHREARAAAQLIHPNIATVHDVIDEEGRPYIVMEYVEGESLSAIAARGPLPVEKAVAIVTQIADGLAAAHAAGVIHRDLKPANVIVTSTGQVKLLDFGVARFTHHEGEPLTAAGQVVGTPGYVAPELLLGRVADQRCDIYSAGMILYQLLSGRAPWQTDGDARSLEALLTPVRDLRALMPSIPPAVSDVVMRAVAREPKDRFQTAQEFKDALEQAAASLRDMPTIATGRRVSLSRRGWSWAVIVAGLVLITLVGMPFLLRERGGSVTARALPVVAVLPLTNLSGDPRIDYIGAGMADTIATKLAGVSGLAVASRAEVHDATDRSKNMAALSRALGASYLVTGGVQQSGDRLQVTINLLSPDGSTIVAGEIYQDAAANVLALQRRVAEDLAQRITGRVALSPHDRQQLARDPTSNVSAISAYWKGRGLMDKPGADPIDPAIAAFTDAVAADSTFALGYAGLGSAYWRKYVQTKEPQWARKAVEANEHAKQLAPDEPEVRLSLATVYRGLGRSDDALAEVSQALKLQSTNDRARRLLGDIHVAAGRFREAEDEYRTAIRIRPEYWETYRSLGLLLIKQRRYEEAVQAFRKVTEKQPDNAIGYSLLGMAHSLLGDFDAARADYEGSLQRGGTAATLANLGTVAFYQGRFADAVAYYRQSVAVRPNYGPTHWSLADAYRRLQRNDDARVEYEKAVSLFDADLAVNAKDAVARATRATCLARLGRTAEALRESEQAVADGPRDEEVHYQHALVLMIAGNRTAAVDALRQAVNNGRPAVSLRQDPELAGLKDVGGFQDVVTDPNASATRRNQ